MYSAIACARCCIDMDCSHTRPGPVRAARKIPEPNRAFWMPCTVVMLNCTDSSYMPTCPGCTRSVLPGCRSKTTPPPLAPPSPGRVFGHEQGAVGDGAAERAHETTLLTAGRSRGLHLDRHGHPGKLARFSKDLVVGLHA